MYGIGKMFHQKQQAKRMDAVSCNTPGVMYVAKPRPGDDEIILVSAQTVNGSRKPTQRIFSLCEGNRLLRAEAAPGWKVEEKEGGLVHLTRHPFRTSGSSANAASLLIGTPNGKARWAEVFVFRSIPPPVARNRMWREMRLEAKGYKLVPRDEMDKMCNAPVLYTWGDPVPVSQKEASATPPASSKVFVCSFFPFSSPCFTRCAGTGGAPWARASREA